MNWIPTPRAPRDFTDAILVGLRNAGILMFGIIAAAAFVALITPNYDMDWDAPVAPVDTFTMEPVSPAEELIHENDCWTGKAPENVIPGHAVIAPVGKAPKLVPSDRGFAIWLGTDGQPGTGDEAPGTLYAFCP